MRPFRAVLVFGCAIVAARPAAAQDFWKHWGDGRAELNGYRAVQPRYGANRAGSAVLIYVTEDFSDSLRVKADPGKHPASDVFPVLKLNFVRHFQTGIYDYNVMTSTFARVAPGWPIAKVSFSSQEWCGHVWHQLVPRGRAIDGLLHSYFDGEADGRESLGHPEGGLMEDALPIVLRGWNGELMKAGESRSVPYLPSLISSRLEHKPLAWGRAQVSRAAAPADVKVPAGTFAASVWTVAVEGGPVIRYAIEAAPPFRVLRRWTDTGEDAQLLGTSREAYWKQNGPGGEAFLKKLGLRAPSRVP
jgi:hypothetical protein